MLKLKYLFENYDLAKEALKNWEHDEDTLDNMLSQFRISSNGAAITQLLSTESAECQWKIRICQTKLCLNMENRWAGFTAYLLNTCRR